MKRIGRALGWLSLATALACHSSGTWNEEAANWRRAFGQDLPAGVVLTHSRYWRSPHWFREEAYYFAFTAPAEIEQSLRAENGMVAVADRDRAALSAGECLDRPSWFPAPGAPGLEAWSSPGGKAALYKDPRSSLLYLAVCQL